MTENQTPAGWYPDGSGAMRWWDGTAWTDQVHPSEYQSTSAKKDAMKTGWQRLKEAAANAQPAHVRANKDPDVLFAGQVEMGTIATVFKDGTFSVQRGAKTTTRDRLVAVEHGADSMRRKSVTGRGAAAVFTTGASLAANNNRGVVYLRLVGADSGLHSWTKRNPTDAVLNSMRSLKAAADSVLASRSPSLEDSPATGSIDVASQLQRLSELHQAGDLTEEEFTRAKTRLLS
jgi:hypothetical protein